MQTIRHKHFGQGTVIRKELKENGSYIAVRFDTSGKESVFAIPESFETGLLFADGELKAEVDSAIAAKREAERVALEAEKERLNAKVATSYPDASGTYRTQSGNAVISSVDRTVRDAYEAYLINKGYSVSTPGGAPSTVMEYSRAVNSVLEEEHLTWSALKPQITRIIALYGEGGAKELEGNRQHKTVINSLKRFEEFC